MTERTIQILQILDEKGYGIRDLINLIEEITPTETEKLKTTQISSEAIQGKNLERRVSNILLNLGMQTNLKGFKYCKDAICILYQKGSKTIPFIGFLYPEVARKNNVTSTQAERAIRHAIENVFNTTNFEPLYEFFGTYSFSKKGKPTNSEFITAVVEIMRMEDL